jgi:membrane protein
MDFEKAQQSINRLDSRLGNPIAITKRALERFGENRAAEAAASISYYTIFSLFPLLIFTVTAFSFFVDTEMVIQKLTELTQYLPIPTATIVAEVEHVLDSRGAFNLIALIGFLWAASGVFNTLVLNLDRAFQTVERRSVVKRRLVAIAMVFGIVMILMIVFVAATLLDLSLLSRIFHAENFPQVNALLQNAYTSLLPYVLRFFIIWLLYTVPPARHVNGWAAVISALFASLAWRIATSGFAWYLNSGLARYDLVYGSLGAIIVFLTWIYLSAWILLFGAFLTEAIDHHLASRRAASASISL